MAKIMRMAKITKIKNNFSAFLAYGLLSLSILPSYVFSQEAQPKSVPKIEYYKDDDVTNQIPYFDNRFRIDAEIEELTMLFYRQRGSEPVILIRPDGSKLKISTVDKTRIEWYDDSTFDMIRIKKPMRGPWQAVGAILPESKIMVMSDVRLEVAPLPTIVLSGETLKVTGRLFNGEQSIDNPMFRHVVKLDVDFYSTNNSAFDNFGADAIKISSFRDDGHELDEYAGDNIFTGEFLLDFAPGEWQPVYLVTLPMITREVKQVPIVLRKNPITLSVDLAKEEGEFHQLHFNIDSEFVDVDSLVFQGKVKYPDKQFKPFSIMPSTGNRRTIDVEYTEPGIYRVSTSAFGETIEGREFRLVVKEFNFNVKANELDDMGEELTSDNPVSQVSLEQTEQELAQELEEAKALLKAEEDEKQMDTYIAIAIANVSIILIVFIGFMLMKWRQSKTKK